MKEKRVLHLNLHREFFDLIADRKKRFEYRRRTPYWKRRLDGQNYDLICFRNGYATKAPVMVVKYLGKRIRVQGRSAHYAIQLGQILEIKNYKRPQSK